MMIEHRYSSSDICEAVRSAFARLLEKGRGRPDCDLARDPDFRKLHGAGMQIAFSGGEAAIRDAVRDLCATTHHAGAQSELERFWFGMGRWTLPAEGSEVNSPAH